MIIKPKYKGFICLTAHPTGCYRNVEDMVNRAIGRESKTQGVAGASGVQEAPEASEVQWPSGMRRAPKNVVIIGGSTGYGLASRIAAACACKANTASVIFEKPARGSRTATSGFYNDRAVRALAVEYGANDISINIDAFSNEAKQMLIKEWRGAYGDEKIDLLIYSIAAPKRIDPKTGEIYTSVIKPIGRPYHNKTLDFHTGQISEISIKEAGPDEIEQTVKVMGGEDWQLWIEALLAENLLSVGMKTVAFSYIGPELTHAIYKDGAIGRAKDDLLRKSYGIDDLIAPLNGRALISVNKAIVTQSSAAIPVVTLYMSLLYKVMKEKGSHEDKLDQMLRLFFDNLYSKDSKQRIDHLIRLDDLELKPEVQAEVAELWEKADSDNIEQISDVQGYRAEFFSLFGFGRDDVDYEADVTDY